VLADYTRVAQNYLLIRGRFGYRGRPLAALERMIEQPA